MIYFSLIIPVYNEEQIVEQLYTRCTTALGKITDQYEIICVDDGSDDNTLAYLLKFHRNDKKIKVVSLSRNFGHQSAILAGFSFAKGEIVGVIDGDLQDPPEFLSELLNKLEEGFDVVYAIRKKRKENIFKRTIYLSYYRILRGMSNIEIPLDSGDFSVMRHFVVDYILRMPEQSLFLRGIRSWVGFRQTGIEYEREKRQHGLSKYTFRKLFRLAYNGIFSFSHFPVKILSRAGFLIILFSILYIIFNLIKKYVFGDVPQGFTTIIIFLVLFNGIQLLALGIIGEYVLRIYEESRKRPLYIIRDKYLDD